MSCDVGEVTERLENEQSYLQYNEPSSFSNLFATSPTSQLILQPFRRFTYVRAHSPTLPLLHLHHSSFSNPSFASPTSQALHLIHVASRPCMKCLFRTEFQSSRKSNAVRSGRKNITLYKLSQKIIISRARWLRGNARDSHSGGLGFKSRCRPTWLRFFCGFPQSSRQMLGWIFITTIHLTIIHQIHIS